MDKTKLDDWKRMKECLGKECFSIQIDIKENQSFLGFVRMGFWRKKIIILFLTFFPLVYARVR